MGNATIDIFTRAINLNQPDKLISTARSVFRDPILEQTVEINIHDIEKEEEAKFADALSIKSTPTLILFVNCQDCMRTVGADPNVWYMFHQELSHILKRTPEALLRNEEI